MTTGTMPGCAIIVALTAGLATTGSPVQTSHPLILKAQQAVGSAEALRSLQSVHLQGRVRVLNGATGQLTGPYPLEIRIMLPDRYLRIENRRAFELRSGFARDKLLSAMVATSSEGSFGATYAPDEIDRERQRLGHLMLGLLAYEVPVARLPIGPASSPTAVSVPAADGGPGTLEFDQASGLPIRLRYEGNVHFPVPGSTMPPPPERAEIIWTYGDRRTVAGLAFPHRIVRTSRDITLEEITFDSIVLNTLTEKAFTQ